MAKREGAPVLFLSDMSWPQLLSQIQIWTETRNQHPRISLPTLEDGMLFSYVITYTYTNGPRSSLSCTNRAGSKHVGVLLAKLLNGAPYPMQHDHCWLKDAHYAGL